MASKQEIQIIIMDPMQRIYQPPKHWKAENLTANMADYFEALAPFGAERLRQAWQKIRDEHRSMTWPMPGEIVAACRGAEPPQETAKKPQKTFVPDSEILSTDMGQRALRGGWGLDLVEFCDDHGRYPTPDEIQRLARAPQSFREGLLMISGLPQGPQRDGLENLARTMSRREDAYREKYLRA